MNADIQHDEIVSLLSSGRTSCDGTIGTSGSESRTEQAFLTTGQHESYLTYIIPVAISILLAAMDEGIVVASYTSIASDLNQLQSASWIQTAYLLAQTSFQPLCAKLSDIFGRKPCLLTYYAIYAFGSLLVGLSMSMTQLILGRAIAGIGAGGIIILATIIIADVVPLRVRGTWQGATDIVAAVGIVVGAPLGGYFSDFFNWRWAFRMQVLFSIIAFFTILFTLRLPRTKSPVLSQNIKRIDFGGAITLFLAVAFLMVGLDRGGNISLFDWLTIGSLIAFTIFAALFVFNERFIALEPFAPARIVLNRFFLPCYIPGFFQVATAATQVFCVPLFYRVVEGKTASETSVLFTIAIIAVMVGSLSSGFIMQYTGRYYALVVASYLLGVVGTSVVFLSSGIIAVSMIGLAIGLAITEMAKSSGNNTAFIALTAHARQEDQATAIAVFSLFKSMGGILGFSMSNTLVQNTLRYLLHKRLPGDDVQEIVRRVRESLSYLNKLDPVTKTVVVHSYENAIQVALLLTIALAALAALSSSFIKEKALTRACS